MHYSGFAIDFMEKSYKQSPICKPYENVKKEVHKFQPKCKNFNLNDFTSFFRPKDFRKLWRKTARKIQNYNKMV